MITRNGKCSSSGEFVPFSDTSRSIEIYFVYPIFNSMELGYNNN